MRICISNELVDLKEKLSNKGYVIINNMSNPCDAIICDLKNGGLINLNIQNNLRREGTLIIDSGSKSIEEIEYILNNRIFNTLL